MVQISADQEIGFGAGAADIEGGIRRDAELIIELQFGWVFFRSQEILHESGVFGIIEVLIDIEHGFLDPVE